MQVTTNIRRDKLTTRKVKVSERWRTLTSENGTNTINKRNITITKNKQTKKTTKRACVVCHCRR